MLAATSGVAAFGAPCSPAALALAQALSTASSSLVLVRGWSHACRAQRRVLEFRSFVTEEFMAQSFWVPNALKTFFNTTQNAKNTSNTAEMLDKH